MNDPGSPLRELNRDDILLPRRKAWSKQTVAVANPVYAGERYGVRSAEKT